MYLGYLETGATRRPLAAEMHSGKGNFLSKEISYLCGFFCIFRRGGGQRVVGFSFYGDRSQSYSKKKGYFEGIKGNLVRAEAILQGEQNRAHSFVMSFLYTLFPHAGAYARFLPWLDNACLFWPGPRGPGDVWPLSIGLRKPAAGHLPCKVQRTDIYERTDKTLCLNLCPFLKDASWHSHERFKWDLPNGLEVLPNTRPTGE